MPRYPQLEPADLCLYHWSPTHRRSSIQRLGLVPGRVSLQGNWRPPYVAFSDQPGLAWQLSGDMFPEIPDWDLWMVNTTTADLHGWEACTEVNCATGLRYTKEYRVYYRVYKRDVRYVATRTGGSGILI